MTWCFSNDSIEDELLAPLWSLLESDDFKRAVDGPGRLRHRRNGPPDPLTGRVVLMPHIG